MNANPDGAGKPVPAVTMTLADMRIEASRDGQHLLIYCRQRVVAMLGPMGCDVEEFEFADVGRMTMAELIGRL
jgi:hypothetical protein